MNRTRLIRCHANFEESDREADEGAQATAIDYVKTTEKKRSSVGGREALVRLSPACEADDAKVEMTTVI